MNNDGASSPVHRGRSCLYSLVVSLCMVCLVSLGYAQSFPRPPSAPPPPPRLPGLPGGLPPQPFVAPLPPPPPQVCSTGCDVAKKDRVLIFLNDTSAQGAGKYRLLYQFLESSGRNVTSAELGPFYNMVFELSGKYTSGSGGPDPGWKTGPATAREFLSLLHQLQWDSTVKAVDVLVALHGSPRDLFFQDGPVDMRTLLKQIVDDRQYYCTNLSRPPKRDRACEERWMQKLRMVYSAACYGASHAPQWIEAGFAAAAGAIGVHTDSVASFPTFLSTWKNGYSFTEAVNRANRADERQRIDQWAKLNPDWSDANSKRILQVAPGVNSGNLFIWTKSTHIYQ